MRLSPSRFVVTRQTRIDLHEQSPVETKPRVGRRGRDRAHQEQSTGREQEKRERDLADHQGIADPDAARPAPLFADLSLEVGHDRATGQRPGRPGAEDQRGHQTEPHGPDEHSPVEIEFGEAQGDGEHRTHRSQQRAGRPRRQQQPDSASGQREEQPFGEQLPREAPSAAAE